MSLKKCQKYFKGFLFLSTKAHLTDCYVKLDTSPVLLKREIPVWGFDSCLTGTMAWEIKQARVGFSGNQANLIFAAWEVFASLGKMES